MATLVPVSERSKTRRAALWPSEALVSDTVGRIIEFWGFKRNMGRIWTVLFVAAEPLPGELVQGLRSLAEGFVAGR